MLSRVSLLLACLAIACGETERRPPPGADGSGGLDGGGAETGTDAEPPAPCEADQDCETGFCDLGACAEPQVTMSPGAARGYGAPCDEDEVPMSAGDVGVPLPSQCPNYRCKDGRCRSCESADECGDDPGTTCEPFPGLPGQICGGDPNVVGAAGAGR